MPFSVMIIVLLAALLHASWNFLVKRTDDPYLSMSAVVVGHTPFAAAAILCSPWPRFDSLPYILAGALLHVGYQLFLPASYRIGDLSQVYPLARGAAPLIVTAISITLLGVPLSRLEIVAVVAIGVGIMSLSLVRQRDGTRNGRAAALALTTGGFIAAYSLVDGSGAREAGTVLGFYGWLSVIDAVIYAIVMRMIKPGIVGKMIRRNWRLSVTGGAASFLAYSMVIWAFTLAPIALVTALRETSIIFALLLGVFRLKERLDPMKMLATLLTLLGIVLLRIGA